MKYRDLIFDLYGTLVDIRTVENDAVWAKTAVYFGFYGASYSGMELKQAFQRAMNALDMGLRHLRDEEAVRWENLY